MASPKKSSKAPDGRADASKLIGSKLAGFLSKKLNQTAIGFKTSSLPCVSTGSAALDNLIGGNLAPDKSGPICPGYPRRHITEIYGPEASGKTTLALEAIKQVQADGGIAMFLDFEHALSHAYASTLGVDFDPAKLLHYQPTTLEQGFEMIKFAIVAGVDLIIVDSVAAMVPQTETEKSYDESAKVGVLASKLSTNLPKLTSQLMTLGRENNPLGTALILLNQERAVIQTGPAGFGGPKSQSAGGNALKFYAYLRLMVKRVGSMTKDVKDPMTKKMKKIPYGNKTTVKVVKSKVDAKQGAWADLFIRHGQGIDEIQTITESGVSHGLIKRAGSKYIYKDHSAIGVEKFRNLLVSNPSLFNEIRDAVIDILNKQAIDNSISEDEDDEYAEFNAISETDGVEEVDIPGEVEEISLESDEGND